MSIEELVLQVIAGLSRGSLYFIVAAGLTLLLGSMDVINLAHGSFYMVAAFLTTSVYGARSAEAGFLLSLIIVPVLVMALAVVVERLIMRRIYDKGHFVQLLATFALLLIIDDVIRTVYGTDPRAVGRPSFLTGSIAILGHQTPVYNFFVIAAAAVTAASLLWLLSRTDFGRRVRAAVDDPDMVAAAGLNLWSIRARVFVLAAALAAVAGVVVAPSTAVVPGMDVDIIITAFAVTIIGGLGSITGAVAGAVLVGVMESIGVFYVQRGSLAIIFLIMVLVLAFRPKGLFAVRAGS